MIRNKVALVTAGSGGIGKAIVYKLLDNNYNVASNSTFTEYR